MHARTRELVDLLGLAAHPEGGHYRRVHAATLEVTHAGRPRAALSAIHYLLAAGEISRWHCIDAEEAWHHAEGAPLELYTFDAATRRLVRQRLGAADAQGATPLVVVPAGHWQAARPLGNYALVGCSVGPAFEFAGFRLLDTAPQVRALLAACAPDLLALA